MAFLTSGNIRKAVVARGKSMMPIAKIVHFTGVQKNVLWSDREQIASPKTVSCSSGDVGQTVYSEYSYTPFFDVQGFESLIFHWNLHLSTIFEGRSHGVSAVLKAELLDSVGRVVAEKSYTTTANEKPQLISGDDTFNIKTASGAHRIRVQVAAFRPVGEGEATVQAGVATATVSRLWLE